MPKNPNINKVVVIGSGPIIIGQAAEFDYAGTQACRALKEEGVEVVLINSNPATIMTDKDIADRVYIEPLTTDTVKKVVLAEKPDSVLPTLGGQNALNLAVELEEEGFFAEHNVRLIGTTAETIRKAEDRQEFKDTMEKIHQPCADSLVVHNVEDAVAFADKIGYPVVVRPAFTLGGTGGGIAHDKKELEEICGHGLQVSRVTEALIERYIGGWKEIEFEVIRDGAGNCVTVCSMENVDPVGVHTGDSIVVAPSQTLADKEYQMLRSAALAIIEELKISGGCNVQFALNPGSFEYAVIEVNPRLSRSSALASKATGYPIARVASKIALGFNLDEIQNAITKKTYACFEPTVDYVYAKRKLGTQMKATGEVMGIGVNFESALMKAIRCLETNIYSLRMKEVMALSDKSLAQTLNLVEDRRLFVIAEALRRGYTPEKINQITTIDLWFIDKIASIVETEKKIETDFSVETLRRAKYLGFTDKVIGEICGRSEDEVRELRYANNIKVAYKMVDTCAAEFDAETPYYYSCYESENEVDPATDKKKVMVIGSGPIRIGQGVEFDYCSVHSVWALREAGYETIIVNNNPETVSTDFDVSDKLYFEPLTPEDVRNIVELEQPYGAVVQFGGQTAIKLCEALDKMGVRILGTSAENMDKAEDRELFDRILSECDIPKAPGRTVFTCDEAIAAANEIGYPVLVRPSYVLGGQGMHIAFSDKEIREYIGIINRVHQDHPILVDKYIMGKEVEVDAICDGTDILIPGIMEHIERAGVHSGDSISVYPCQSISKEVQARIVDDTRKLALALGVVGMINIQFIVKDDVVYIIEANPRSSRTVPYISKITGIPIVKLATQCLFGDKKIPDLGFEYGLQPEKPTIAIKMPVFSFEKLYGADISLGPEMKSTGEVLGIAYTYEEALIKAFVGTGIRLPRTNKIAITVKDMDKEEVVPIAKDFVDLGYEIYCTAGTSRYLSDRGIPNKVVKRIEDGKPNYIDMIINNELDLIINTPTQGMETNRDGYLIRRNAVECGVHCFTSLDTARALANCLKNAGGVDLGVIDIAKI